MTMKKNCYTTPKLISSNERSIILSLVIESLNNPLTPPPPPPPPSVVSNVYTARPLYWWETTLFGFFFWQKSVPLLWGHVCDLLIVHLHLSHIGNLSFVQWVYDSSHSSCVSSTKYVPRQYSWYMHRNNTIWGIQSSHCDLCVSSKIKMQEYYSRMNCIDNNGTIF